MTPFPIFDDDTVLGTADFRYNIIQLAEDLFEEGEEGEDKFGEELGRKLCYVIDEKTKNIVKIEDWYDKNDLSCPWVYNQFYIEYFTWILRDDRYTPYDFWYPSKRLANLFYLVWALVQDHKEQCPNYYQLEEVA